MWFGLVLFILGARAGGHARCVNRSERIRTFDATAASLFSQTINHPKLMLISIRP